MVFVARRFLGGWYCNSGCQAKKDPETGKGPHRRLFWRRQGGGGRGFMGVHKRGYIKKVLDNAQRRWKEKGRKPTTDDTGHIYQQSPRGLRLQIACHQRSRWYHQEVEHCGRHQVRHIYQLHCVWHQVWLIHQLHGLDHGQVASRGFRRLRTRLKRDVENRLILQMNSTDRLREMRGRGPKSH